MPLGRPLLPSSVRLRAWRSEASGGWLGFGVYGVIRYEYFFKERLSLTSLTWESYLGIRAVVLPDLFWASAAARASAQSCGCSEVVLRTLGNSQKGTVCAPNNSHAEAAARQDEPVDLRLQG